MASCCLAYSSLRRLRISWRATLRSVGTSGRWLRASASLRLGVGRPLPAGGCASGAGAGAGVSFLLRPITPPRVVDRGGQPGRASPPGCGAAPTARRCGADHHRRNRGMSATVREVAPGVHLLSHAHVNCYLVEDDDGVTLVDAGLPKVWRPLAEALRTIGRTPRDLRALVLTHAHFDHVGVARRLQERLGLPVWATAEEHQLVAHPYRYAHENPRALYPI